MNIETFDNYKTLTEADNKLLDGVTLKNDVTLVTCYER